MVLLAYRICEAGFCIFWNDLSYTSSIVERDTSWNNLLDTIRVSLKRL